MRPYCKRIAILRVGHPGFRADFDAIEVGGVRFTPVKGGKTVLWVREGAHGAFPSSDLCAWVLSDRTDVRLIPSASAGAEARALADDVSEGRIAVQWLA